MRPKSQRSSNMDEMPGGMVQLGAEGTPTQFCCTKLPRHWRSNKSLAAQFKVIAYEQIPDNTRCSLLAGNDENHSAQLKNNVAHFHNNVAEFSDLRFVGKSGRGKLFNVTITIWSDPIQVLVYKHAIKVTADGPRPPRPKSGFSNSQDNNNTSSESSTEDTMEHRTQLGGIEKKLHKARQMRQHSMDIGQLSQLGLIESKNLTHINRPSSCASNSSTLTTTTPSIHSLASTIGSVPSSSGMTYQYQLAAAVVANLLCQTSQLAQNDAELRPASYGHKPWLKHHEKIWRPYIEDSH